MVAINNQAKSILNKLKHTNYEGTAQVIISGKTFMFNLHRYGCHTQRDFYCQVTHIESRNKIELFLLENYSYDTTWRQMAKT